MKLKIHNTSLTATFTTKGAELTSLTDAEGREYIWQGDPEYWSKHAPVLFPVVGTLKNNTYTHKGNTYTLPRHGFARDYDFNITVQEDSSITFALLSNDATKAVYPFDFELQIKYTLVDKKLEVVYTVHNRSDEKMPFSLGAHPAFALPDGLENYNLKFEKDEHLISNRLEDGLISDTQVYITLNNRKLPLEYSLFKNDALVFKKIKSDYVGVAKGVTKFIKVNMGNFPNLGIWTKLNAPFICIEPWQGYADTLSANGNIFDKEGILVLEKDGKTSKNYDIEIL